MLNLFKKKISVEEMATGLYLAIIRDTVKEPLKSEDGDEILSKEEQSLMLLSHISTVLDSYNLKEVIPHLLSVFVQESRKPHTEADWSVHMLEVTDSVSKIKAFFSKISPESDAFYKQDFLFDKNLDFTEKTIALAWYVEHAKAIDVILRDSLKKFKL